MILVWNNFLHHVPEKNILPYDDPLNIQVFIMSRRDDVLLAWHLNAR
jgi:hypothetical protein